MLVFVCDKIFIVIYFRFILAHRESNALAYRYNVYNALCDFPDNTLLYIIAPPVFSASLPKSIDYIYFIALNHIE